MLWNTCKIYLTSCGKLMFYTSILESLLISVDAVSTRTLYTKILCPSSDCPQHGNDSWPNLIHTRADGEDGSMHYIFSTIGYPSILVGRTAKGAKVEVDYKALLNETKFTNGSIKFSKTPSKVLVVMFSHLIDYVDEKDVVDMRQSNKSLSYDLSNATWKNVTVDKSDPCQHIVKFAVESHTTVPPIYENGTFHINFQVHCNSGYGDELPYLQYNNNMSLIDIELKNISTRDNSSRLALSLVVATNDNPYGNMSMLQRKTIDDEHSPGSFILVNWLIGEDLDNSSAFLEWKPACYRKPERSMQSLSSSRYYDLKRFRFTQPKRCLAFDYFGYSLESHHNLNIETNNISFGLPMDKFYRNTNYTVWSFSVGFGTPPEDKISPTIILIIAIGLGIPAVLMVSGFIYSCYRGYKRHGGYTEITSSYSEIN